jgi:hypothetical protein
MLCQGVMYGHSSRWIFIVQGDDELLQVPSRHLKANATHAIMWLEYMQYSLFRRLPSSSAEWRNAEPGRPDLGGVPKIQSQLTT